MTLLGAAPAEAPAEVPAAGAGVPWSTVLPLALVLAYADGFWVTSLRGAVGAISRTQEPFTSFWRTSTLALPVFVFAVLAALTYARRRFGSELRSKKSFLLTGLLVALAATAAAVALSAGSAGYDYYLQSGQLGMMQGMQHDCSAACASRQEWMTITAHVRAVGYTSVAVLGTNLVLVGWVVAIRGGTLRVSGPSPAGPANDEISVSRARDLRLLMVVGLVACAAVHAAVVPEHLQEWWAAGVFFALLTVAELAVAAGVARPGRAALVAAAVSSAVPLVVWAVSRTVGLPFGPDAGAAEAVGVADTVSCLLEVGTLVAALLLLRRSERASRPSLSTHARALAVLAVVSFGALGVAGAATAWFDGVDAAPRDPQVVEVHHHG